MSDTDLIHDASQPAQAISRVLARKYRPETFDQLIGQDATVTMLKNALAQNRVAQAMIFSGVRGTGKTTLARIVAKSLNCATFDAPTAEPCGYCTNCQEIAAGNSLDVQEIDAASHTGVDHIRDIIGSISYRPSGRFKVYIFDEVHMLSTSAFNALLKTLEEPPAHVRFIFATTELRKIPATVLSRTQRFRLKRVENAELIDFLHSVVEREEKSAEEEALACIVRAADGSVRDALSILDQFLSAHDSLVVDTVRDQLGLGDRQSAVALLEALFAAEGAKLLSLWDAQSALGTDGVAMVQDMLFLCHQISRFKVIKADDPSLNETEKRFIASSAEKLSMGMLARLWQLLQQGSGEVKSASNPQTTFEMLLIRALYVSEMPTPAQILAAAETITTQKPAERRKATTFAGDTGLEAPSDSVAQAAQAETSSPTNAPLSIMDFRSLVMHVEDAGEREMASILRMDTKLKAFSPGKLALYVDEAQRSKIERLAAILQEITHQPWKVKILESDADCAPSLQQQAAEERSQKLEAAKSDSTIMDVQKLFPGADLERLVPDTPKE